jgi:hypothetical protein
MCSLIRYLPTSPGEFLTAPKSFPLNTVPSSRTRHAIMRLLFSSCQNYSKLRKKINDIQSDIRVYINFCQLTCENWPSVELAGISRDSAGENLKLVQTAPARLLVNMDTLCMLYLLSTNHI